ncbi:MAG: CsgG/HfaB family protein [Fibrobacterota bacterium]
MPPADADYIITGSVTEYSVKTEGSKGLLTQSKTQTAKAAANMTIIDIRTGRILFSGTGRGTSNKK